MARSAAARAAFVARTVALLDRWDLDGVDYNWEYPGYVMGRGYGSDGAVARDYDGLRKLVEETAAAFGASGRVVTLSYYPDGRQEQLLARHGILDFVSLAHAMTYDQPGENHSPVSLAEGAIALAKKWLDPAKCTLGLPFYGRDAKTGDWTTYEDLQSQFRAWIRDPTVDAVADQRGVHSGE